MKTLLNVDCSVMLPSMHCSNPLFLGSGVMDEDAGSMLRMIHAGAGGVVTKSIGLTPRTGHDNPTVVEVEGGLLNAMGLPNPGIAAFVDEIVELKDKTEKPIVGSIYADNPKSFEELAIEMGKAGVDALELNISCPHAKGYGLQVGSDPGLVKEIVCETKKCCNVPIWVKLSPNVTDIVEIGRAAVEGGADALVAINTVRAMAIDSDARCPILANRVGGMCGPAIKPIGIRCVYDLYEEIDVPIIGVGGISCGKDVVEYLMAGAQAVEIATAIWKRGPEAFSLIHSELVDWMIQHNVAKISELVGVAHG